MQRYMDGEDRFGNPEMVEDPDGNWVKYGDVQELLYKIWDRASFRANARGQLMDIRDMCQGVLPND